MAYYILNRLLFIIPFSILLILLTLILNQHFSISELESETIQHYSNAAYLDAIEVNKCQRRKILHQDWPIFYITVSSSALPKHLQNICSDSERSFVEMLCLINGNKEGALKIYEKIKSQSEVTSTRDFKVLYKSTTILELKNTVTEKFHEFNLKSSIKDYSENANLIAIYIPKVYFNGIKNQFHFWLQNALQMDFGYSSANGLKVTSIVQKAIFRTLSFTIPAVIIVFLLAIVLGMTIALLKNRFSRLLLNILYFIDAIPLFWLSLLLITVTGSFYFTTSSWKSYGESNIPSFIELLSANLLPILALVIVSLPYLTKQVYSSFIKVNEQPYIQTAVAKGVSQKQLIYSHIMPNALIPITVLFFNYLAFAFGGAFVVEVVFSIDGMGKLMADSILANDYQVVSMILLLLVLIKMLLMIVSDMVNYMLNPSIKFQ